MPQIDFLRLATLPLGALSLGLGRLGDGVLFDVEDKSGDPLDEPTVSGSGEGPGKGLQQRLPDRPQVLGLHGTTPVGCPGGLMDSPQVRFGRSPHSTIY